MTKRLVTLLISLIYLTESAAISSLPSAVQYRKDCLRPLSTLRSGKRHKNPVSPVNNVALDLASEDFDTIVYHQIYEKLKAWKMQGRPVSLSCRPTSVREVTIARRLGFSTPLAKEVARLVVERVEERKGAHGGKSSQAPSIYTLEARGHPFDFGKEVRIGGRLCNSIILVTTDNLTTNQLADALGRNNTQEVRRIIENGGAIPIGLKVKSGKSIPFGFKMVMTEKSPGAFSSALGLDAENMKLIIPHAEKLRLEKEADQARRREEQEAKRDELVHRIESLIGAGNLDEAKRLLTRGSILNEFKEERLRLTLLAAEKYLARDKIDDYKKAMELLTARFGEKPEDVTAREFLQQAREVIVDDLLVQGKWYEAWKVAGGPQLESGKSDPLCEKVARTAREPENVPEWLPLDQCLKMEDKASQASSARRAFSMQEESDHDANTKLTDAYRELVNILMTLDEGVFCAISNYARACTLRKMDVEKHQKAGLNNQTWPDSSEKLKRDVLSALFIPASFPSIEERAKTVRALVIMSAFLDAIKEFYVITEPNRGPSRLERLSGERQKSFLDFPGGVFLRPDAEIRPKELAYTRNLFSAVIRTTLIDEPEFGKRAIAESLRGFVKDGLTLPLLFALGIGPYPSFALQNSLIMLGALPMLEPPELADRLDEEDILDKDIVRTTTGHVAIRIFLKKRGFFKGPLTPGIRTVFLYPLKEPGNPDETRSLEEAAELLEDWPQTLKTLRSSTWEGPQQHFIVGGIDFEFRSRQGFERLLDILFPEAQAGEKEQRLEQLCAIREQARAGGYPEIPDSELQFVDEHYNRLITLMNHYVACQIGYTSFTETALAARAFVMAFFEPVYKDLRTQSALLLALDGEPYLRSKLDEIVARENAYSDTFAHLITVANIAYHALEFTNSSDLNAEWPVLTSWDPGAPKDEIPAEIESRRELWYIIMEAMTSILSVSLFKNKFPDNLLFELDESGHVQRFNLRVKSGQIKDDAEDNRWETDAESEIMNARFLRILEQLGYRPFIEEQGLVDIVNTARAHKSVEVIGATEHSPPSIVITLEKDWEIIEGRAKEVSYVQNNDLVTDKLVIVLFDEDGIVMDEDAYHEYVDEVNRCLIKGSDGNSELSNVIGGRAKVAIPHILVDVERFNSVIKALAIYDRHISLTMRKILHQIPKKRKPLALAEVITGIREQGRVDAALRLAGGFEAANDLDAAAKVIVRTLADFPNNTTLQNKAAELTRLCRRRDVLKKAKDAIAHRSRRSIEALKDALSWFESFYGQTSPTGPSLAEDGLIRAIGNDSAGLRVWRSLRSSALRSEERVKLITEAESCLEEDPDRAEARVQTAKDRSWGGEDVDRLLKRIARRREHILEEGIWQRLSGAEESVGGADAVSELLGLRERLDPVEHDIEKVSRQKVQERMIEKIDEIRDAISEKLDAKEKGMAEIRERISKELESLKQKIETIPVAEEQLEGYDIKAGPTREDLRVWGRQLRSAGREIEKFLENNSQTLKDLFKQVDELYGQRQMGLGKLVNGLKKEVKDLLSEVRGLTKATDKKFRETGIREGLASAKKTIPKIPSTEIQREMIERLKECKEFVRQEKEKSVAKEIKQILREKEVEISKMEEEAGVAPPDERLREQLEASITDDELKQNLLARLDNAIEAYRMRNLAIRQKKTRDGMESQKEMWLRMIRSFSPVAMKNCMEAGSRNAYKSMIEYLDSLNTEDPAAKAYVDDERRKLDEIVQPKLANINGFGNGQAGRQRRQRDRRDDPPARRQGSSETAAKATALDDIETGLGQIPEPGKPNAAQRVRLSKLKAQFAKARSAEGLHAIADTAHGIFENSAELGIEPSEAKEYADFRDMVRAAARKAPKASELIQADRSRALAAATSA